MGSGSVYRVRRATHEPVNLTMRKKTSKVQIDISAKSAATTRALRPVLLPNSTVGRVGGARAISFGWADCQGRRFGR